jgi:hypothetical protein
MKQLGQFSRHRIKTRDIRTFVPVVVKTGERQIAQHGAAAVLFGNNVVEFEGSLVERLGNLAVLAPVARTLPNFPCQRLVHEHPGDCYFFSAWRAFD